MLCHQYVYRVTDPRGVVSETRSPRSCDAGPSGLCDDSTGARGEISAAFKADLPGTFEVSIDFFEYDNEGVRPDAPVVKRAQVTAR